MADTRYTDTAADGSPITINQIQIGYLVAVKPAPGHEDMTFGIVTELRGGGAYIERDGGGQQFVPYRQMCGIARPE